LKDRFSFEQPFLFYHAALALQNAANIYVTAEDKKRLLEIARQALHEVKSFAGTPDRNTMEVLESLIADLSRK
jgi:dihydrodipicolinate synthase/N-acetylneuraminate lyase